MEQLYGYTGKRLRVNLTTGQCAAENEDPAVLREYLGGTGLGARFLYEEVLPGVGWSDPDNRLILASGPLGGTRVMGSGNFTAVTKGALTEGPTASQANGYFGAYLKMAGFDSIVIHGKADKLSYLYVHEGNAELRDARHLAGKDTWETEDLIKKESGFGPQAMSVFGIGPAGENRVRFAALVGDRGHVAGHNGTGAVMGAKNLKAIAVARGKPQYRVHDAARLSSLSSRMFETIKQDKGWSNNYHWGTLWIMAQMAGPKYPGPQGVPFKNYATTVCPMTEEQLATFRPEFLREKLSLVRRHPCWACQMHHCDIIRIPEGPCAGLEGEEPEYEGLAAMGPQVGIYNGLTATALANEVDRLGLECNETGWVLGLVMECFEKGVLTRSDTDGLEMSWGNADAVRAMLNRIARRQGVGNTLAEGAMRASRSIGGDAPKFAIYAGNGTTPVGHDHRRNWPYQLDNCVSNTGSSQVHVMPKATAIGLPAAGSFFDHREVALQTARVTGVNHFIDSLGVCRQSNREIPDLLVGMLNAATGWDFSWKEAMEVGLRAVNLLRAFYVRHGYTPELEAPSPRYGSSLPDGPDAGKSMAPLLDEMLDVYYREMGWDRSSGKPLPETLRRLGLGFTVPDLWAGKLG